jgi:hypothetical protein
MDVQSSWNRYEERCNKVPEWEFAPAMIGRGSPIYGLTRDLWLTPCVATLDTIPMVLLYQRIVRSLQTVKSICRHTLRSTCCVFTFRLVVARFNRATHVHRFINKLFVFQHCRRVLVLFGLLTLNVFASSQFWIADVVDFVHRPDF